MDIEHLSAQCRAALQQQDLKGAHHWALSLIQQSPNKPIGYFYIAQIPMQAQQFHKAIPILQKALSLCKPDEALVRSIVARLMQCFGITGQAKDALALFKQSVFLPHSNNTVQLECLDLEKIAVTLTRFEWHALALPIFERSVKTPTFLNLISEQQAKLYCNVAASCAYQGAISDAIKYYRKALSCEPRLGKAHAALSRLNPTGEQKRVAQLQTFLEPQLISSLGEQDNDALYCANALFHELEKQQDYAQAGNVLHKANAMYQEVLESSNKAFSLQAHCKYIEVIRELAKVITESTSLIIDNDASKPSELFIVGLPRSGSTLLDSKLTQHQQIVSLGERDDIERLISPILKSQKAIDKEYFDQPSPELARRLQSILVNYQDLTSARLEGLELCAHAQHSLTEENKRITYTIDKMHLNIWYTPLILALFPKAKIIAVKKNDRDLAWGNYKYLFNPQDSRFFYSYDLQNIQSYIDCYHQQVEWLKAHFPQRIIEVEYEQFVANTEAELTNVYAFLGLKNRINSAKKSTSTAIYSTPIYSTASAQQVREGVSEKYVGQWQRYKWLFSDIKGFRQ